MRPFSKWRGIRVDQVGRAGDHFGASAVIPLLAARLYPFLVRYDLMPHRQPHGENANRCGAGTKSAAASLRTFMRLPVGQRSAVILRDVLGHSVQEVCDVMGGSIPAIKSALQRGRLRLRELDQEPDNTPGPVLAE